ncbi:MAG: ABC transporter permease subunit [Phycisphaerales bacterium]|nr:ABC transporter permease subunit [Phycisphaerales bacterium]
MTEGSWDQAVVSGGGAVMQVVRHAPGAVLRWLRSMNPVGTGPWAIFQKEMRSSGRRRATYWARGMYALVLAGVVGLIILSLLSRGTWETGAARLQRMQEVAPMMAITVLWFEFVGLIFAAPMMTGPALCDERRNRTLPALLTTPLTAGEIVFGKLVGGIGQMLILGLIPLPVLLGMRVFGGLNVEVVLAGMVIAIGAAILSASWALAASLHAPRGVSAAITGWAMMIFLHGLVPPVLAAGGGFLAGRLGIRLPQWLAPGLCPPWALGMVSSELVGMGRLGNIWMMVGTSVGGSLSVSALLWFVTVARLRRVMSQTGGEVEVRRGLFSRKKSKGGSSAGAGGGDGAGAGAAAEIGEARRGAEGAEVGASRTLSDRPVLWRELRQSAFRSRAQMWVIFAAAGVFLGIVYSVGGIDDPDVHHMIATLGAILFGLSAAVSTSSAVGQEREAKTWPILLTTPLSPREIVWGKFIGGLSRMWVVPGIVMAHFVLVAPLGGMVDPAEIYVREVVCGLACAPALVAMHAWEMVMQNGFFAPVQLGLYLVNLACAAVFLGSTGVLLSLVVRRVTLAGVMNLLLAIGWWLALPLLVTFISEVVFRGSGSNPLSFFFSGNPIALAIAAAFELDDHAGWVAGRNFGVVDARYTTGEFVVLCGVVWLVYGAVSWWMLAVSARVLEGRRDQLA